MQFDRHERVNSLIIGVVASFIRSEANPQPLITVTNATISDNYRDATIFITTIPASGEDDALLFLKRKGTDLRNYMKKHSKMKVIPHFTFEIDRGERHRQHIDEVAKGIEKKD